MYRFHISPLCYDLYSVLLYYLSITALYCTVLYCTVLYCTAFNCPVYRSLTMSLTVLQRHTVCQNHFPICVVSLVDAWSLVFSMSFHSTICIDKVHLLKDDAQGVSTERLVETYYRDHVQKPQVFLHIFSTSNSDATVPNIFL